MLDAVIRYLPAPGDVEAIKGILDDKAETEASVLLLMMSRLPRWRSRS
jgi:translation elongation factor EF-G